MKKLCVLMLTGIMAFASVSLASAEEEVVVLDYSMIDPDVYEGSWVTAFNFVDMYLPNDWTIVYNAEEGDVPEDDIYFLVQSEDESQAVFVTYSEAEYEDLDALAESLQEDVGEIEHVEINGISGLTYVVPNDGVVSSIFSTVTLQGNLMNIYLCAPEDDDEFAPIAYNIACSVSPVESPVEEVETEN